jgi:hypothetical protein
MSGFIKTIRNLLGDILSFFVGLFGGKKSQENQPSIKAGENQTPGTAKEIPGKVTGKSRRRSGYFMELDEAEETKPVNGNKPAHAEVAKAPKPVAAAQPAKAQPAKTPEPAANAQPAKAQSAKTPEPAAAASAATKVELVQTAKGVKAEPVKSEPAPAASTNGQNQTETTFAPKYLVPSSSNSRRRPGPNMNPFLDMARQVKTPG